MKKVRKIKATSLGKVLGLMYAFMGLLFGGLITIFAVLGVTLSGTEENFGGVFLGVGAVIILPIMYGVLGFIFGIIFGWFYNVAAKWTGGLEVEVEELNI